MKPNYRITFGDGPAGNRTKSYDVHATDSDDAFKKAYKMPESKMRGIYSEVSVEKIPDGASNIGIKFSYYDSVIQKNYKDYLIIRAMNEAQAVEYYNRNYKGKHFWFQAGKIEPDGKCVYGNVIETYFAAVPGYNASAI